MLQDELRRNLSEFIHVVLWMAMYNSVLFVPQKIMLLWNAFKSDIRMVKTKLTEINSEMVVIPDRMTSQVQPSNVSVNKRFKGFVWVGHNIFFFICSRLNDIQIFPSISVPTVWHRRPNFSTALPWKMNYSFHTAGGGCYSLKVQNLDSLHLRRFLIC